MSDFEARMHSIRLPLGLLPRPHRESLHRSTDLLSIFNGTTSKGGMGKRREEEGDGKYRDRGE